MAESAVSLVIDELVPLLVKEAKLLKGVHKEVADIKDELDSIKSFLKDADTRAEKEDNDDGVKIWVNQVRETAYHIEDVVDEYMLRVAQRRHWQGFVGFLHKVAGLVRKLKMGHEISSEIRDIKASIREVNDRRTRYSFNSSGQGSSSRADNITGKEPPLGSLFIEEAETVGIESPRDEPINLLVNGKSSRTVISVAGMGGLGKTTLTRKVYNHVSSHFDCHAWIPVSQSYRMQELLRIMLKQLYQERKELAPEGIDVMEGIVLAEKLREYLQQKSYVIVFDDVWSIDFWKIIKPALPDNDKGSRIMITTRHDDVASSCKESQFDCIHKLQPLSEKKAWELFCNKAFQSDFGGCCPPELEILSREIVGRCEGLPLAIVAIGCLLSTKRKDVFQWKQLHDSLGSELNSNPHLTGITRYDLTIL